MKKKYELKIKLKAFDSRLLDRSTYELIKIAVKSGGSICGPIPLPVRISKYIVNRSPHKDKKSREQFGVRFHKRLMLLSNVDSRLMKMMTEAQLPSGVEVEISLVNN